MLLPMLIAFCAAFALIWGISPPDFVDRPKLQLKIGDPLGGKLAPSEGKKPTLADMLLPMMTRLAVYNRPLASSVTGRRIYRDLAMARTRLTVEEFFLIKEILIFVFILVALKLHLTGDFFIFAMLISFAVGYMAPEFWLKGKIGKTKNEILRTLPDTVDLLGLCVNAGLDFMMALKYVVEKSQPNVLIEELKNMIQEINVGKPRRDALRDLAKKYELPDMSTFSRTLIQADRMGTSVIEALNILSEDMREARYRRGEALALKAPLKMLVPLLFFIFPVVAILVAGPVFLDFFHNNPLKHLAGK